MDVSFDASDGRPVYKVKTYQNNEVWEAALDAQSGQFVDRGATTSESQLDEEDKAALAGLQQATVTLAQAVNAAEKSIGGKAMTAGLEETNGKVVYEITVVQKTGFVKKVIVDPRMASLATKRFSRLLRQGRTFPAALAGSQGHRHQARQSDQHQRSRQHRPRKAGQRSQRACLTRSRRRRNHACCDRNPLNERRFRRRGEHGGRFQGDESARACAEAPAVDSL